MSNPNYIRGRAFEYDCMKRWKDRGFKCVRSSGSHGIWDVCAVRIDGVSLIQCKVVTTETEALRMLKNFKEDPPMMPSKHYHMVLEVKLHGTTRIFSATV